MRVFMTGATGYVGGAIVRALVQGGHKVTGLVRSPEKESLLRGLGAIPLRGDMKEPSAYKGIAAEHDAMIHVGFEVSQKAVEADRIAIETLLAAARTDGGPRSVLYTSGVWVLGNTGERAADEDASTAGAAPIAAWRPAHERLVLAARGGPPATAVIRPGIVYGGRGGLVSQFFSSATTEGAAAYVGPGTNRWSLVHRDDLAQLYRLAIEKRARGIFHGVDGAPVTAADAARAASQAAGKGGATRSIPVEEARKRMGPVADALCLDQIVSTRRSAEVGWKPKHVSFPDSARAAFEEWRV